MNKRFLLVLSFLMILALVGCEKKEEIVEEQEILEEVEEYNIDEIIKEYKPNELGDIPVIMYHAILEKAPSAYQRTIEGFKKDLAYMYEHDFVTLSMQDYVNFNIDIPAGKTPIVITFDDGEAGTFDLVKKEDGTYAPRENTAIYLMEEFYKEHPDFGKNAILYINGHAGTFNDSDTDKSIPLEDKIKWLFDNGYEVSNHTSGHLNIKQSSDSEIQKQIAAVDKQILEIKSDAKLNTIAYPFGAKPKEGSEYTITNGSYDGHSYSYQIGFREGPSKPRFVPVISTNFEPLNVPRLRGNEGELGDMWSYFDDYEEHPNLRFVSDGNKDIITVPLGKESEIDRNKIGDKEIKTYDVENLTAVKEETPVNTENVLY